jgi:hypothetical protein
MHDENTEMQHEDVKAFMNEAKAPEPMMVDDFIAAQENGPKRMNVQQITQIAYTSAWDIANVLSVDWPSDRKPPPAERLFAWTREILNAAADPNPWPYIATIYDSELMIARENGDHWLPFSRLSIQAKMPWLVFRQTVCALAPVWNFG